MFQRNDSHSLSRGSRLILLMVALGLLMSITTAASAATKSYDRDSVTEFKTTRCSYGQLKATVWIAGPQGWNAAVKFAVYKDNGQYFPHIFTSSWEGFTLGSGLTEVKRRFNAVNGLYKLKALTAILNPYTNSWVYSDWVEPVKYTFPGWTNYAPDAWCMLS